MSAVQEFMWWTAEEWEAMGTWATVLVALVAAAFVVWQIRDAKRARIEEDWAYVAIYMESSQVTPQIVDVVVKNYGKTAASNVKIASDVPLQRSTQGAQGIEDVWLPSAIPTLVPGQEWRTMWDFAPSRVQTNLSDRHEVTVSYTTSDNTAHTSTYVLDWGAYKGRRWTTVRTMHDAAKALQEIQKTTKKWNESVTGALSVYVRDGDAKDRATRDEYEAWLVEQQARRDADAAATEEETLADEIDAEFDAQPE